MEHDLMFLWGCIGSGCDELLHWGALRQRKTFPTYVRSVKYWIVTALLVLMGGIVAFAFGTSTSRMGSPLGMLVVGYSAPALIKSLSKALLRKPPTLGVESDSTRPSILSFLTD
jgi:hypothetical protein